MTDKITSTTTEGTSNLLTIAEVAAALRVDIATVSRWCVTGLVHSHKLGPTRRAPVRIPASELQRILSTPRQVQK
jgi:predicted site-specific integrase-resolvase